VNFFEEYINNAPISTGLTRNMRTGVYSVEVLELGENLYGYYFHTVQQFQGVDFEPIVYGSVSLYDYSPNGGEALMIRTDDVDYIYNYYGTAWTTDLSVCDEVISVNTAIQK